LLWIELQGQSVIKGYVATILRTKVVCTGIRHSNIDVTNGSWERVTWHSWLGLFEGRRWSSSLDCQKVQSKILKYKTCRQLHGLLVRIPLLFMAGRSNRRVLAYAFLCEFVCMCLCVCLCVSSCVCHWMCVFYSSDTECLSTCIMMI
jgi:hypothetical protein